MFIHLTCPYCGFKFKETHGNGSHIITCPSEDGGCDTKFVIEVWAVPSVKVYKLESIEAINEPEPNVG